MLPLFQKYLWLEPTVLFTTLDLQDVAIKVKINIRHLTLINSNLIKQKK